MQTVLQRSSSKTLPDVLMLDNPEVKDVASLALAPLGDFKVDTSAFAGNSLDAVTQDGQVYGLPLPADTLGLFYNTDILAAAGITPPKTWDELKVAAAKLTKGDQYGLAFSAAATYEGACKLFLPFMWTNGGDETKLDSPEVKGALQLYVDLVNSGSASKSVVNWNQADVKDQFLAGKAAMMVNGPWQIPALAKVPGVKRWNTVQIPVNKPGQTPTAPLGRHGLDSSQNLVTRQSRRRRPSS